jgi:hypothetical protein
VFSSTHLLAFNPRSDVVLMKKQPVAKETMRDPLDMGLQQVFCGPLVSRRVPSTFSFMSFFFHLLFFGVYGFIDTTIDHLFADIFVFYFLYLYIHIYLTNTFIRYNLQPSLDSQCAPPVEVELARHLQFPRHRMAGLAEDHAIVTTSNEPDDSHRLPRDL